MASRSQSLLSENAPPPGDDRGVHLVGLFFLRPVAAAAHEMLGQIGDESGHAGWRELRRIQLGRDHERRRVYRPVATGCVFPVAGDVAIPVDSTGEAAPSAAILNLVFSLFLLRLRYRALFIGRLRGGSASLSFWHASWRELPLLSLRWS